MLGNGVSLFGGQLCAVRPVHLVAVVFLGVVACGDIEAGGGAVMPDGKAQLGSGAEALKNADMDAVCCHNAGGLFCKLLAVEAAVTGDNDALVHSLLTFSADNVCEGLSGMADDVDVHVVKTHLHGAAKAGSAELQRCKKAVFDFLFVVSDGFELCPFLFAECGVVQPVLIFFPIIPHCFPPHKVQLHR